MLLEGTEYLGADDVYAKAIARYESGRHKDALPLLTHSLYFGALKANQLHQLFRAFVDLGKTGFARKCVAKLNRLPSVGVQVIPDLCRHAGQIPMAPDLEQILEKKWKSKRLSEKTRFEIRSLHIQELLRQGRPSAAVELFLETDVPEEKLMPVMRVRIIEAMLDLDMEEEAARAMEAVLDENRRASSYFIVLQARLDIRRGQVAKAIERLEKNLAGQKKVWEQEFGRGFVDETYLLELGLCCVMLKQWRHLQEAVTPGHYQEPVVNLLRVIADEKERRYETVARSLVQAERLDFSEGVPERYAPIVDEWVFSTAYSLATIKRWDLLERFLAVLANLKVHNPAVSFFQGLGHIYGILKVHDWYQARSAGKVLGYLEMLMVADLRAKQLVLLATLYQRVETRLQADPLRRDQVRDIGDLLLFLIVQVLEAAAGSRQPEVAGGQPPLADLDVDTAAGMLRDQFAG